MSEEVGKNEDGKFIAGNKLGRGRPPKKKGIPEDEMNRIVATHLKKAQEGNAESASFILEYERFIAGK